MKQRLIIIVKVCVSALLIGWLIYDTNLADVWATMARARMGLLIVAFALFYVGYVVTAARWSILQRALGGRTPYWRLVQSFMVAVFFNNFLPSTMGGDVVRMYDSWRSGESKTVAVAAVLMDRAMGVAALLTFAMLGLYLVDYQGLSDSHVTAIVLVAALLVFLALACMALVPWSALAAADDLIARAPARLAAIIAPFLQCARAFRSSRMTLLYAFLLSLLLQSIVVFYHWIVAAALGLDVELTAFFLIVPITVVVMMIPISINGIGVREGLFVMLLGVHGVTQAAALAYAWVLFAMIVVQGIIGGFVFLMRAEGRSRPGVSPDTMKIPEQQ